MILDINSFLYLKKEKKIYSLKILKRNKWKYLILKIKNIL